MSTFEYARRLEMKSRRNRARTYRVTLGCGQDLETVYLEHVRHVEEAVRTAQRMFPGWTALVAEEV